MRLVEFIESNRERIVRRWQRNAEERMSLDLSKSQLRNDLPHFIDDVIEALRDPGGRWPHTEGAKKHGRQRMRVGVKIGSLTEEMTLVGETVAELAFEDSEDFASDDVLRMMAIIGRGAAASVSAYAALRDRELADQAAQHFSFIAHEIRNPLHNARLAAQVLAIAPESEREKHQERLDHALADLTELVDDSLIEARLYGDPRLDIERADARELVEAACGDLAAQQEDRDLSIATDVEDFSLDVDRTLILSALTNLLKNAVKFTREGGRIAVEARQVDGRAVFEVGDQCGGIPDDVLPLLFEPFVQADPQKGGSGLGLVIVKQAAEAHGGSVQIDNRPGDGCRFVLELPRRQQS
jgi:signal transduction histidine kinase